MLENYLRESGAGSVYISTSFSFFYIAMFDIEFYVKFVIFSSRGASLCTISVPCQDSVDMAPQWIYIIVLLASYGRHRQEITSNFAILFHLPVLIQTFGLSDSVFGGWLLAKKRV